MALKQIVFFYLVIRLVQAEIKYDIIVPDFICDISPGLNRHQKKTTTIELVGDGKIDLFKINFKRIGKPCKNPQRCNLIAWKVTRQFEKYLNNYPNIQTNSIEFNNSMLIPGLKYIINIFVSHGRERAQKQATLNVVDDHYVKSSKPLASITLNGLPSTQTYITYILNAEVNICSQINGFYFLWELLDEADNVVKILPDRSPELNIPPFTFHEGKKYIINSYLKNLANDEIIAKNKHSINVQSDVGSLLVKLPMVHTTVKAQQSIYIKPYIKDLKNEDDNIKKKWSCMYNKEDLCENNSNDELYIENGFINEGEYNISLTVTRNAEVTSALSLIKVLKEVPSIDIDTIETPVLPSSGVTITAKVEDLRTFCTVQWKSEQGPYFIDLNCIPGKVNQVQHVIARRDLFLRELEEFSSDAVTKEYSLIIPPPLGDWQGLPKLDEDYKLQFLLEVKCPKAQLEHNDIELNEEFLNDTITISALVELDVVVPPKVQSLEITPEIGVALDTIFTFHCKNASKTGVTYFLYRFGYDLGDRKIVFASKLGFGKAETILPYGDTVRTFVEVCEEWNSCETTFGPSIKTTLPNMSNIVDAKNILSIYEEKLNAEDFPKAFGYALSILTITEEVETYNDYFSSGILHKIRYLLNTYDGEDENWGKRVNKLINSIKEFNKNLAFSEDVLNGLVELRDKLLMDQRDKLLVLHRNLLTTNRKKVTLENFKSYVEVSDLVITSSSDVRKVEAEKIILEKKLQEYLGRLCAQLYEKQQIISLEYQILILVLQKLPKRSYNTMHVIPFTGNPWNATAEVELDVETLEEFGKDKLCIAKMLFKDYFNKSGISYGVYILDGDGESLITEPNIKTTVLMPLDDSGTLKIKTPKCVVYNNGWTSNCTFIKQVSKSAEYSCSTTGVYHLDYEETLSSSTKLPSEPDENKGTTKIANEHSLTTIQYTKITEKTPLNDLTSPVNDVNEDGKTINESNTITNELNIKTDQSTTAAISESATSELVIDSLTTITTQDNLNDVTDDILTSSLTDECTTISAIDENTSESTLDSSISSNSPNPSEVVSSGDPSLASTFSTVGVSSDAATEITTNKETATNSYPSPVESSSVVVTDSSQVTKELSNKDSDCDDVSSTIVTTVTTSPSDEFSINVDEVLDVSSVSTEETNTDSSLTEQVESSTVRKITNEVESTVESNDVQTNVDNEVSIEVTSTPATVLTTTRKGKKGGDTFGIFGGISGNFFTNFSVKFSLNTTFMR